ncbi:MAG: hypothetical protein R2854_10870 [Caldilineaceae bacterium]
MVVCRLTKERAELYETTVQTTLDKLDRSDGIRQRSRAGAGHQAEADHQSPGPLPCAEEPLSRRSGKLDRLTEMLDEALSVDDRALVFTRLWRWAICCSATCAAVADRRALPPRRHHGQKRRDDMVQLFQSEKGPPIFVLNLRGGIRRT